jgi:hypothetical protein
MGRPPSVVDPAVARRLRLVGKARERDMVAFERSSKALYAEIVSAYRAGVPKLVIATLAGTTRITVRKALAEHGLE